VSVKADMGDDDEARRREQSRIRMINLRKRKRIQRELRERLQPLSSSSSDEEMPEDDDTNSEFSDRIVGHGDVLDSDDDSDPDEMEEEDSDDDHIDDDDDVAAVELSGADDSGADVYDPSDVESSDGDALNCASDTGFSDDGEDEEGREEDGVGVRVGKLKAASEEEWEVLEWYNKHKNGILGREAMNGFLRILNKFLPNRYPRDIRTLEKRVVGEISLDDVTIEQVDKNGDCEYAHIGLDVGLRHLTRGLHYRDIPDGELHVWLYADGVTKFDNPEKKKEFWPLLCRISNVPYIEDELVTVGVYYGSVKPTGAELLKHFVADLKQLYKRDLILSSDDGITDSEGDDDDRDVDEHRRPLKVKVILHRVIADAPARAMLKCIVGHTGFFSCERCEHRGYRYCFTTVFTRKQASCGEFQLRSDKRFRDLEQSGHHQKNRLCEFTKHDEFKKIDMIQLFPIDTMHAIYLGTVKRLLYFLTRQG
jgi:hypothetical protein